MSSTTTVGQFAWTYLHRYKVRLAFGVLLGVLFGLSSAGFVWATRTITERLDPDPDETSALSGRSNKSELPISESLRRLDTRVKEWIDPWLPKLGPQTLGWRQIVGGILLLPMLVSLRSGSGYLSSYCMGWVSERAINDIRYDILEKLSGLSLEFFDRSRIGDLLARINTDTINLQRTMRSGFADLVKEAISVLTLFVTLCIIDWQLTLISMVVLPACLVPVFRLGKKARRASKASIATSVAQFSQLVEVFSGVRIIKAFGLESTQLERFRNLSRQLIRQGMKGIKAKEMVNPVIEIISTTAVGILIVYLFYAQSSVEEVVGFLTALLLFYTPVKKLAGLHVLFEQTSVAVHRLVEVMNERPSVGEPAHPKPLRRFQSEIEFDNVSFAYGEKLVLNEISLTIPRGLKLGIAGPSGSGKSTLVNLLFRFYDPTRGALKIDGLDVRLISLKDLRALMALVSQEVILFDQTVAESIACGRLEATRAEIEAAARAAYAHDFILQMPNGYDTRIGERGVTLSGGQRQRLAIARAFVRNAPILVLDEATASLDSQSEAEVQAAIEHLAENRTVICVAHRLSTLASMHRIIVLAEGRVVEDGSYEELLEAGGMFAGMARPQGIAVPTGRI